MEIFFKGFKMDILKRSCKYTFIVSSIMVLYLLLNTKAIAAPEKKFYEREDVQEFINYMVSEHDFNRDYLLRIFKEMKPRPKIVSAISNPAEAKKWYQYRPIFIQNSRIKGGVKFMKENLTTLNKASDEFGVPREMITAIVGVETKYGSHTGRYRVIDSLATLGFVHTNRTKFFRKELEHFLLLTRDHDLNPFTINGSYAGAMGKPQFISSSYRNYAVDYDENGKINLWDSNKDVIGSVANYFKKHKWHSGEPIAVLAKVKRDKIKKLLNNKKGTPFTIRELENSGVAIPTIDASITKDTKVNIIELKLKSGSEYWITFHNFYVIMKYNHSKLYAMSAFQLSKLIESKYKQSLKKKIKKKK